MRTAQCNYKDYITQSDNIELQYTTGTFSGQFVDVHLKHLHVFVMALWWDLEGTFSQLSFKNLIENLSLKRTAAYASFCGEGLQSMHFAISSHPYNREQTPILHHILFGSFSQN